MSLEFVDHSQNAEEMNSLMYDDCLFVFLGHGKFSSQHVGPKIMFNIRHAILNHLFQMMNDYGFIYDSTMTTPLSRVPSWPFSLEYKIPFKCRAGNCPSYSYPGKSDISTTLSNIHTWILTIVKGRMGCDF